jgi:hypothetical protein
MRNRSNFAGAVVNFLSRYVHATDATYIQSGTESIRPVHGVADAQQRHQVSRAARICVPAVVA